MATTTIGIDDEIWVPASDKFKEKVYVKAKILAVDEFMATARTTDSEQRIVQIDFEKSPPMMVNPRMAPDMCGLHHIHEPGILQNLEDRSYADEPYTAMGSVMVAMNPLRRTADPPGMCGEPKAASMGIPHPFQMAEVAFQQMAFTGSREVHAMGGKIEAIQETLAGQSIVISGESGAGKTESAKMSLAHLVRRGGNSGGLDQRLLGTNPILEAFGNATTLRNPNSSRFGKLLKLHFVASDKLGREYRLDGASVETYLLERSRITFHAIGERNYHVFYMMMIGGSPELVKSLGVQGGAKDFVYMLPTKDGQKVTTLEAAPEKVIAMDKQNYLEMDSALGQVGIGEPEKKDVWSILAAILHMGNFIFEDLDRNGGESDITAATRPSLEWAAKLLGVDANALVKVFSERHVIAMGDTIIAKRNARAAKFAVDAVAKATYSKLFDWLIVKMDIALRGPTAPHKRNPQIGVLDIFGFESFALNGFEQLLINYTNEALQATFNRQVFVAEAQLYEKEGLFGSGDYFGRPQDNSVTLELLQGPEPDQKDDPKTNPRGGLLMIIDAEGMIPDAGDNKFNQRLHQTYNKQPAFLKPHPKDIATTFIIKHYAGAVIYTIGTFLEKNNDSLPGEVDSLLSKSTIAIVRDLFPPPPVEEKKAKSGPPKKPPAKSIVRKFQNQIKDLVNNLEATRCSFIRCVKPNPAMKRGGPEDKGWYDRLYVQKQLHCLNIPQTAEVLRNGFPTRIHYAVLVDSYKKALPRDALLFFINSGETDHVSFIKALFHAFEITGDQFKLGLTRVFFRSGQLATLDKVLRSADEGISKETAKRFKSFYIRNIFKRSIAKVLACNKWLKILFWLRKRAKAVLTMQSVIRMVGRKRKYQKQKKGAIFAQKHWRGRCGRKLFHAKKAELLRLKHEREEAEKAAKLKAIAEAKDAAEKKRLQEEMEKLKQQQEEEHRKEKEAAEKEAAMEREKLAAAEAAIKHAEQEAAKKAKEEAESMNKKRRQTMMPGRGIAAGGILGLGAVGEEDEDTILSGGNGGRKTRVMKTANGKIQISRKGHKLRQKSIAPQFKRDIDRKQRLKQLKNRIHGEDESKSPEEMLSTMEREDFRVPVFGFMHVRSQKKSFLFGYKWTKLYFMLVKPDRLLRGYVDSDRSKEKSSFQMGATTKVTDTSNDPTLKKKFTFEVQDHVLGRLYFSCDTNAEKERWMRDVREAITGFVSTAKVVKAKARGKDELKDIGEDEEMDESSYNEKEAEETKEYREMYAAQLRKEKIAQLKKLLDSKIITQKDYDDSCKRITEALEQEGKEAEKEAEEEYDFGVQVACPKCFTINNSSQNGGKCIKCKTDLGVKQVDKSVQVSLRDFGDGNSYLTFAPGQDAAASAKPLDKPLCNTPYHNGVFSCSISGSERGMDFATFEEFIMYIVECRYKRDDGTMIGWSVARRFKQWRTFATQLEGGSDTISPFDDKTRAKLPVFPKKGRWDNLRGVRSAAVVAERDAQLKEWLKKLLALAPDAGKGEKDQGNNNDDDDEEPPEVPDKPDSLLADKWECVRDAETGEEYWWNKETGIATWERPREDSDPPPVPPKPPLMHGWEAIKDPSSGEVYYWHSDTQTSTWERPMNPAAAKIYDATQLLHIPPVAKFFDLKKFVIDAERAAKKAKSGGR